MDKSIYVVGEEIDEILKEKYGLTDQDLINDDGYIHSKKKNVWSSGKGYDYFYFKEKKVYVCDATHTTFKEKGVTFRNIADYLDKIDATTFYEIWSDDETRKKMAALFRFPGGYHEWLTIANIFHLKGMGISLHNVVKFRTPTVDCIFYVNGKVCHHGETHSTKMHNDLYQAIENAYTEYVDLFDNSPEPIELLKKHLITDFLEVYYKDNEYPEAIQSFLDSPIQL